MNGKAEEIKISLIIIIVMILNRNVEKTSLNNKPVGGASDEGRFVHLRYIQRNM